MCHNSNKMPSTMPEPSAFHLCVVCHYRHLLLWPGEPWVKFLTSLLPNTDICKTGMLLLLTLTSFNFRSQRDLPAANVLWYEAFAQANWQSPGSKEGTPATFPQCPCSSLTASLTHSTHSGGCSQAAQLTCCPQRHWRAVHRRSPASRFPPAPCCIRHSLERPMTTPLTRSWSTLHMHSSQHRHGFPLSRAPLSSAWANGWETVSLLAQRKGVRPCKHSNVWGQKINSELLDVGSQVLAAWIN